MCVHLKWTYSDRDQYQLGTLSHIINTRATGYQQLPDWPEVAPDPSVRNVEVVMPWPEKTSLVKEKNRGRKTEKSFYSSSESSSADGKGFIVALLQGDKSKLM